MNSLARIAYDAYERSYLEQGCSVDQWDDLEESDKVAWEAAAKAVASVLLPEKYKDQNT